MNGMEIASFPIVLWVLSELLAGAASIVGSYQKDLNYDWYRDCLFSYCVVSSNLFNGTLYPEIIKTNFCLIY